MSNNIIKIDYNNIDVEDIMRQIRENISKRNYSREDLDALEKEICITSDDEFDANAFASHIATNNTHWNIQMAGNISNNKRFIGPLIVLFKRAIRKLTYWYVKFLFTQQIEFNASVTNSINQIDRYIKYAKAENDYQNKYYSSKINNLMEEYLRLSKEISRVSEENYKLKELVIKLENDIYMLRSENTEKINHMKEELLVLSKEANKTSEENCRKLEDALNKLQQRDIPLLKKELEKYLRKHEHVDMDYTQFEHKFRGTREEIKRRQAGYLKYFLNKNKVLDIGCGRGEFLELLKESNIDAIGIDLNRENVKYCNEKGLSVVHADAIEYLSQCDNSSLGGVFMSQVAEHLRPNELISIIKLAKKKLQPGAYIIIETINPTALIVFAESYYMDPTHITLVHPLTLKFLIESEGFSNIETLFLSPVEEANRLPKPDQAGLDEIISKLNDLIYGYRDYSVIAKNT